MRYDDEPVNGGELIIETYQGDECREWLVPYSASVTPVREATYWQPAEGGEVEDLEWSTVATCHQTGEVMPFDTLIKRLGLTDADLEEMEDRACLAISEGRTSPVYVLDGEEEVAA